MVQKVPFTSATGNTMTIGTGTSRVVMGADSGNLKIQDSQSNTSIIEPGLPSGIVGASAISVVANPAALPFNPISAAGTMALATSTGTLYISNGSGWYKISMVNTAPSISLSSATATPTLDNLTLDFTYTVTEPEGTPTTVTLANSGIATTGNVAITHTTSNNHIRLVFDGTTEYSGDATVTLTATDGVNTGAGTITISTNYVTNIKNKNQDILLARAYGTGNNTTFNDASDSNHALTRYGNYNYYGSYSPYRSTGYSYYNTISSNYVTTETHADFTMGTGDYTVDMWVFRTAETANEQGIFQIHPSAPSTDYQNSIGLGYKHSDTDSLPGYYLYGATSQVIHKSGSTPLLAIRDQTWTHIAVTRTSGVQKLFVDGVEHVSRSDTKNYTSDHRISIGTYYNTGSYIFRGYIAGFRVIKGTSLYSASFVPDRIPPDPTLTNTKFYFPYNGMLSRDYHGKTLTKSSVNNDNQIRPKSPYDAPPYSVTKHSGSLQFTGSEYIQSDATNLAAFGTGDFTIEGWASHTSSFASGNRYLFDLGSNGVRIQCYNNTFYAIIPYVGGSNQITTTADGIAQHCWFHFALVRNSGTAKLYINGIERGSVSDSTNLSSQRVNIGRYGGSTADAYKFRGYMTDFRIVKGTAVYTGAFTPPNGPLTKTGGTYPSTTNVNTEITSGHTELLVNFDDANMVDVAQTGNFYTVGDVTASSSVVKHSGQNTTYFDGNGDGLQTDSNQPQFANKVGITDFTFEAYVYISGANSANGDQQIFDIRNNSNQGFTWYYHNSQQKIYLSYQPDGSVNTSFDASYNTWYHIAVVRHNFYVRVYKDGVEIHSAGNSSGIESYYGTLGKRYTGGPNSLRGYLYDLRYSGGDGYQGQNGARYPWQPEAKTLTTTNSTRSGVTVAGSNTKLLIGHAATVVDGSSVGATVTNSGSVTVESTIVPATDMKALSFNGTNQYLTTPDDSTNYQIGTGQFTAEGWMYVTDLSGGRMMMSFGTGSTVKLAFYYYASGDGAVALFDFVSTGWITGYPVAYPNRDVVQSHRWIHLACCRDGSNNMRVFANGKLMHKSTVATNFNNNNILIGKRHGSTSQMMKGYLSNLRFVKGQSLYTDTFTPPTTLLDG